MKSDDRERDRKEKQRDGEMCVNTSECARMRKLCHVGALESVDVIRDLGARPFNDCSLAFRAVLSGNRWFIARATVSLWIRSFVLLVCAHPARSELSFVVSKAV